MIRDFILKIDLLFIEFSLKSKLPFFYCVGRETHRVKRVCFYSFSLDKC